MWYQAHLTAYDCLGAVVVTLTVRRLASDGEALPETALARSVVFDGVGADSLHQWTTDVLVAMLEAV